MGNIIDGFKGFVHDLETVMNMPVGEFQRVSTQALLGWTREELEAKEAANRENTAKLRDERGIQPKGFH
jgi:hypothetical protein